jgi:hypothetical protein
VQDTLRGPGRTDRHDVRAAEDHAVRGILKRAPAPDTREVYSIGMEHVALTLGGSLGLPIPEIWLDSVGGRPVGVVQRVPNSRNWAQAEMGTPAMLQRFDNEDDFALGVVFDIWMAKGGASTRGCASRDGKPQPRLADRPRLHRLVVSDPVRRGARHAEGDREGGCQLGSHAARDGADDPPAHAGGIPSRVH